MKNKERKNEDEEENKYFLDNLNDFNKVLKLFNDIHSNQITMIKQKDKKYILVKFIAMKKMPN